MEKLLPRHEMKADTIAEEDKPLVLLLVRLGFPQRRIAALFDVNQGRISEIVKSAQ